MKVGFIGFGRLGKLIARYMSKDADVLVFDQSPEQTRDAALYGARVASLDEICECKIIIPFVPISAFESVIKLIAPKLKPGTLVIDVCSVKILPSEVMQKHLPDHVQILATHPMFGPDSAKETLYGAKLVLCPIRIDEQVYTDLKRYLDHHGLKLIECTPDEHDQQIANSLILTHLIGRTLIEFESKPMEIDTKGYRRLLRILETVENDSFQLFQDMNNYNPYSKQMRDRFQNSLNQVLSKI